MVLILHFRGLKIFKQHLFWICMFLVKIFILFSKFNIISDYSIDDDDDSDVETIFNEEILETKKVLEEDQF